MRHLLAPATLAVLTTLCACSSSGSSRHVSTHRAQPTYTPAAAPAPQDPFVTNVSTHQGPSVTGYDGYSAVFADLPSVGSPGAATPTRSDYEHPENSRRVSFADEGADFDPAVAADGQKVYFASTRHRRTADIYVQNVHGTALTQLTSDPAHDVMPAISPDGTRVAFASNRSGDWNIYIMNADGGQAVQVTNDPGHEMHPTWSHDGTKLAYCRLGQNADRWEVWLRDLSKPNAVTFLTYGLFPDWHPSANEIVFQRPRERGSRLFSVWKISYIDGEATQPTEIASSPVAAVINPTWSDDGSHVAFAVVPNPPARSVRPTQGDIWIARADGTSRTNLTRGRDVNLMPAWAPDGSVYYISNRSGHDSLWSIRPAQAIQAAAVTPMNDTTVRQESSLNATELVEVDPNEN